MTSSQRDYPPSSADSGPWESHWRVTLPLPRPTSGSRSRGAVCYWNLVSAYTAGSLDAAGAAPYAAATYVTNHGL